MKSRTLLAYAAVCAIALSHLNHPLNAAVESDIVGYTTMTTKDNGWYQIGCHFDAIDKASDEGKYLLDEVFCSGFSDGDTLYFWQTSGAFTCYIYKDGKGWLRNGTTSSTSVSMAIGKAALLYKKTADTVTFAGKVIAESPETLPVIEFGATSGYAWSNINLPYPGTVTLGDLKWEGLDVDDVMYRYLSSGAPKQYNWNGEKWIDPTNPNVDTNTFSITPGRALLINKQSAGKGKVSLIKKVN